MKLHHLLFIGVAMATAALTACSSSKTTLPYFTNLDTATVTPVGKIEITIVPDDELAINVSASDPEAVELYTIPYQQPRQQGYYDMNNKSLENTSITKRRNLGQQLQTYMVNQDGFINFPVLGKIHVAGMTLEGLAEYLTEKISEKVVDPIVTVELINFHVNVLGEVARPGAVIVNSSRYSVLDALASAGDMTAWGERNNVLVIREEDGKRTYHRLNLNDKSTLESPYFYLKQNDVIYVEPNKIRQANSKVNQDNSYKLSMTSVIVSAASVIASLAIAIFIK